MDNEGVQQNMISNLPLLFANGYPTSLEKITEAQLEGFIPFMVKCSLGHINLQDKTEYSEPEWWPEDVVFSVPFTKPKKFVGNWMDKMKEIVVICYQFHKSVFLLRFCNDLAAYEHASLRFINNYNSTTSLFDRRSNKLLVTFRNENMSYDKVQKNRKCLLQQKMRNGYCVTDPEQQMMVEPAPFDIYLCDSCDAELYSKEAIVEHERTCHLNVADVILCDTPEPLEGNHPADTQNDNENLELRIGFLLNFNLKVCENIKNTSHDSSAKLQAKILEFQTNISLRKEKNNIIFNNTVRAPRRNRSVHSLTRFPTIPLSSPAGQLLIRANKTGVTEEYLNERLDRVERFCNAPHITDSAVKPKYLERKYSPNNTYCTFKKSHDSTIHTYIFPRRQFSQKRRMENFMFLNSLLIKKCRPIAVRLKKINENEIKRKKISNARLNIKLTRDTSRSSNWKISSSNPEIIVDTIDLCSSDDDFDAKSDNILEPLVSLYETNPLNIPATFNKPNPKTHAAKATDISLRPFLKSTLDCTGKSESAGTNSSILKNSKNLTPQFITEDRNCALLKQSIHLSPSSLATESALVQQKALHPSVFIFTNYLTTPVAVVSGNNERVSKRSKNSLESENFKDQSSEILSRKSVNSESKKLSSLTKPFNTRSMEWFPHGDTLASLNSYRNNGVSTNIRVDPEESPRNISLTQKFGSPTRIISIDLTS